MASAHIPESHQDLIDGPFYVALTTIMPDGRPQTTPVWCNREGEFVLINTMRSFQKAKNMRQNQKVSLLAYDPKNSSRSIEIRGVVVEMTEEDALEHLDRLTQLYMDKPDAKFFGDSVAAEHQATHHPVKVVIQPIHVRIQG